MRNENNYKKFLPLELKIVRIMLWTRDFKRNLSLTLNLLKNWTVATIFLFSWHFQNLTDFCCLSNLPHYSRNNTGRPKRIWTGGYIQKNGAAWHKICLFDCVLVTMIMHGLLLKMLTIILGFFVKNNTDEFKTTIRNLRIRFHNGLYTL